MATLQPTEPLEGSQKTTGQVTQVEVKEITPNNGNDPFNICEFTFKNLKGEIVNVLGKAPLKVGLACDRVNRQTHLGHLAMEAFGWNDETPLETEDFVGVWMDFEVDPVEQDGQTFWNINRKTLTIGQPPKSSD